MVDALILPLIHRGTEIRFQVRVCRHGSGQRLEAVVNGECYYFEPDEEGNYRVVDSFIGSADMSLACAIARILDDLSD
jgi:hypothetical protein